ncbi:hypothetical protein SXCC_01573 [Gluconacetobacter sp. SXCC-1]|nr:hypothetical protein SXCC_01573 [Gluconacetobacter sp. SXCC-1]
MEMGMREHGRNGMEKTRRIQQETFAFPGRFMYGEDRRYDS